MATFIKDMLRAFRTGAIGILSYCPYVFAPNGTMVLPIPVRHTLKRLGIPGNGFEFGNFGAVLAAVRGWKAQTRA